MFHETLAATAVSQMITFDVTNWSNEQVGRLRTSAAEIAAEQPADQASATEIESTGWTEEAYVEAMLWLVRKYTVQAKVIAEAIKTGNPFVSRERVYELGAYPADRVLKGFTRPTNRIQQDLIDRGLLTEESADLLEPVYNPDLSGYQRASGFRIPPEVIQIGQQAGAKGPEKDTKSA